MSVTAPTFTPTARPDHRPGALGVARSEWTKIRSLRSTYWTLLVTAGLTIGLGSLFALGRTIGWIAHALEQRESTRLIRPRAAYVGVRPAPISRV